MKRRYIVLFLLGFSSGMPFCLVTSTLQAWFSSYAISVTAIGMLSLVGQPYIYKFIWASWLDRIKVGSWERRRGWIFLTQMSLILLLFIFSFFNPQQHPWIMASFALLIAFFSATQDIAIDAYRAEILPEKEQGLGAAFAVAGYRVAVLLSGGLALVMAQYWGWVVTYQCMAAFMLIGLIGNCFAPVVPAVSMSPKLEVSLRASLQTLLTHSGWRWCIFIFLYKLGEAFTSTNSSVVMPFLLQGLHFDLATIGIVNKMGGISSAIMGSFIAGAIMLRWSLFRALLLFGCGQAFSVLMFLGLVLTGKNLPMLIMAVVSENLVSGMSTTALLALMMRLCDHRFTAAHFAFLTCIAALPRIIAGPIGGFIQPYLGWKLLYLGVFFATWPSLFLLFFLFSSGTKYGTEIFKNNDCKNHSCG